MGLCKCPKRKVTNQFCYEHRVNVCEYCMITNHPKCVVLSYLKWLQDGDYNPICELCSKKLNEDECVRLVCYHVFHWNCLDHYARQLPGTMAPAGYTCPSCQSFVFPPSNLVSPVADVLRKKFETVNWARVGLGLPLLAEEEEMKRKTIQVHGRSRQSNDILFSDQSEHKSENTVVLIEDQQSTASSNRFNNGDVFENKFPNNVPRRLIHSSETKKLIPKFDDHDDNKYERRTMTEKFGRLQMYAKNSKYFQFYFRHKYRRMFAVAVFLFVGFFVFMLLVEKLGNRGEDPLLDPRNNPNILVHDRDDQ